MHHSPTARSRQAFDHRPAMPVLTAPRSSSIACQSSGSRLPGNRPERVTCTSLGIRRPHSSAKRAGSFTDHVFRGRLRLACPRRQQCHLQTFLKIDFGCRSGVRVCCRSHPASTLFILVLSTVNACIPPATPHPNHWCITAYMIAMPAADASNWNRVCCVPPNVHSRAQSARVYLEGCLPSLTLTLT